MAKVFSIVFSALFTVIACWSAGKILLQRLELTLFAGEEQFFRFTAGSACFSLLIFFLTAAHLAREWVFLCVGAGVIAAATRAGSRTQKAVPLPDFSTTWKLAFTGILLAYGVYYFVNALAPEGSPDGSGYHLGLVSRYFRWHSFGHITTNMYANLSEGMEMLFLFAFAFGRHSAAAMVEFAFLLALPLGMMCYARRLGFPRAGVVGAVLVFASPVFGISGTVAYNDAAGVCVLFAIFYLLQIWAVTRERNLVMLIGLLAGFAYGIKYTLFLAIPGAALFLSWKLLRSYQSFVKPMASFAIGVSLMAGPWMLKDWFTVGNPFSPFLNSLFPNPYITVGFEKTYAEMMRTQDDLKPADRPLEQTVFGGKTAGFLGPAFLLAPFSLLALRFRDGRQLLLAGALCLVPALTNIQTRFLMPCAPFLALALGLALMEVRGALWLLLAFDAITCWPGFTSAYCTSYAWRLAKFPLKEAVRKIPERTTLNQMLAWMPVADLIEQKVPASGRLLTFSDPPEAYTSRNIVIGYESAFGQKLTDFLDCAIVNDFRPTERLTFRFEPIILRRVRVVQLAKNASDKWSVAEFRLFYKGGELPRSPGWRLSAEPNRFDVGLAFDNDPVTRWSSEEALYPGMWIGVDLGQATKLDSVVLECSHDQWATRLRLEGEVAPGTWKTISSEPALSNRESEWNLRRAATTELRSRGITHLLVAPDNLGAADFEQNRRSWGLELVGTAADARLYRLLP